VEQHLEISGWMRWLSSEEGGRKRPHPGGRYAATAFPESGTIADLRSIVFDDVPPGPGQGAANARWLSAADGPGPGTRLVITEGPRPVAIMEVQATRPAVERPWSFRITSSFTITGRGTGVLGVLSGTIGHGSHPAELHTREHAAISVTVSLEFTRTGEHDRPALLIHDTGVSKPPAGALIRPRIVSAADPAGPVRLRRCLAQVHANMCALPNGLLDVTMRLALS
jgi:hypothetical protein